jgi:hypothetical protein
VLAVVIVCLMEPGVFRPQVTAQQQRDTPAGTAVISGKVLIAGDTNQPARRVRVTLNEVARLVPGQATTTDETGAFTFSSLPAGRFELKAIKDAWLSSSFGAARPDRPGTPIVVKDGDRITRLTMTIARGGVITGAVRDGRGRPVPTISVRVMRLGYNAVTGERTLVTLTAGTGVTTDDRGEYRAYGLPPGNYLVLANPLPAGGLPPGWIVPDIRPLTAADVQQALQGTRASANAPGAGATTTAPASLPRVNYAPVFHPGVTDIGTATTVALGLSEERTGVDVTMQYVPTATLSGTIGIPDGVQPGVVQLRLVPAGNQADLLPGAGLTGATARPAADGTFAFNGVAPGLYTVKASVGASTGRGGVVPDLPALWAFEDVAMSGNDVTVRLTLQPGVDLSGRVVFEGSQPTPAELQTMSFALTLPGTDGRLLTGNGAGGGRVDAQGRFMLRGIAPDSYRWSMSWSSPGASEKWTIKSSVANRRESFETPLRVNQNEPVDWTITFTDKPAGVNGVFQDRAGRAATDYSILVFSTDRSYWTPGSKRIRAMRPSTDGAFSTTGLPAGEYFLAALTDLEPGEWNDPSLLERIVGSAIRVTVRDGEMTRQDLRIGG